MELIYLVDFLSFVRGEITVVSSILLSAHYVPFEIGSLKGKYKGI